MQKFIKKLREKPENVRQRILIGSIIVALPIIFLLTALISNMFPTKNGESASLVGIFQSMFKSTFSQKAPLNE